MFSCSGHVQHAIVEYILLCKVCILRCKNYTIEYIIMNIKFIKLMSAVFYIKAQIWCYSQRHRILFHIVTQEKGSYVPLCGRGHGHGNRDLLSPSIIMRSWYSGLLLYMGVDRYHIKSPTHLRYIICLCYVYTHVLPFLSRRRTH